MQPIAGLHVASLIDQEVFDVCLHHEDWRYPMFRERAGRWAFVVDLVAIHLIPTTQVFAATLPVYAAALKAGHAEDDTAAVCAVLERQAGVKRGKAR